MCASTLCPVHTRWWLKRRQERKWRGSWGCRSVSRCPCLTARRRPEARRTTTRPSCHRAAFPRPVPSLWVTITLTMATGTALWTHAKATLSTSRQWATSEGWVAIKPTSGAAGLATLHGLALDISVENNSEPVVSGVNEDLYLLMLRLTLWDSWHCLSSQPLKEYLLLWKGFLDENILSWQCNYLEMMYVYTRALWFFANKACLKLGITCMHYLQLAKLWLAGITQSQQRTSLHLSCTFRAVLILS